MSDDHSSDDVHNGVYEDPPQARSVRGRWPGLVWAVPLAALIVVGYLGIRALTQRGIDVTVTFSNAEGVTPGDTKVLVNGVEAGHVSAVRVASDAHRVEVTLSLDPRERAALNRNTQFWLIGENPTITDVRSIRAAVVGVIIAMAPGQGGTPTRAFTGLDQPPIIPPDTRGTIYYLDATQVGSVQPGASVYYHGLPIGKIIKTSFLGLDRFQMQTFIMAPYDRFMRTGAEFWTGSPLQLSLTGATLSANLSSPASVLQGAVQFELPVTARGVPPAPPGSHFNLYDDQMAAQQGPRGPEVAYRLALTGPAGDLSANSTVSMLGYVVGRVVTSRLVFVSGKRPYTDVVLAIFPTRLGVRLPQDGSLADLRQATDRAVGRLLMQGYRAHLIQSPPFVGAHVITLSADRGTRPGQLAYGGPYPTIPVADGGAGTGNLLEQADQILTKVNAVPITQIGKNLRDLTAHVATLTGSPQVRDSVQHLDGTLRQLDAVLTEVKPRVGPLMAKLNEAAGELKETAVSARAVLSGAGAEQDRNLPDAIQQLDEAARSIRSLTDYLGRHPEAFIRGKAKEKK